MNGEFDPVAFEDITVPCPDCGVAKPKPTNVEAPSNTVGEDITISGASTLDINTVVSPVLSLTVTVELLSTTFIVGFINDTSVGILYSHFLR